MKVSLLNWQDDYKRKVQEPESVFRKLEPGTCIFIGGGCAAPQYLVDSMVANSDHLSDCEVVHFLTFNDAPYAEKQYSARFRHNAYFIGDNVRDAVMEGGADYTPIHLSQIERLFLSRRVNIDYALVTVSPPDDYGFVNLGISVDITRSAVRCAKKVIAQVNPYMPRCFGDGFIHESEIDYFIEHEEPLIEFGREQPDEREREIGFYIAKLIDDGATIQVGYGATPAAAFPFLKDRHDLGIHSETFSDEIMDGIEAGIITNKKKTINRNKVVSSFALGTRKLYDFLDNNPFFEFRPSGYVNDPQVIKQHDKMVSINTALMVDLTGQVCADSIGARLYSGIGGQIDFIRGAANSAGGKSIIAMPSTTQDGQISRIVATIPPGTGVVTTRADVHYVITEYGIARLHGRTIRERVMEMIDVAHPDFRSELLSEAKNRRYVFADQLVPYEGGVRYPAELETELIDRQGDKLRIRPARPTDEEASQRFFYSLSDESVYSRYFSPVETMPHAEAQKLVNIDYKTQMLLLVLEGDQSDEEIVAMARYHLDQATNMAEIAFTTRDDMQGRGIASFLVEYSMTAARRYGISGFTAYIQPGNRTMIDIIQKTVEKVEISYKNGYYFIKFDI
jgi:acyl-CoA hydrolase/GNAT superfamily N-acetyltransferase